jgi:hypothetical protein
MMCVWAIGSSGATRCRKVLLATACGVLAASSQAVDQPTHPVTIGASLGQAPNVSFDCSVIPFTFPGPAPGGPSCTWGNPLIPGTSAGLDVPGTGTIYRVRLRVGASTGPMQLVVLRTLFDPHDIVNNQCCVAHARSSVFTPVANGITTLNVTLPVAEEDSPTATIDYLDQVGLSILKDKVAIPLINETSLPIQQQPVDDYNQPAMTLGESQLAADPAGYALDMQAAWYPPGQSPAAVSLPAKPVTIIGTNGAVPMGCTLAPCSGGVTIQNLPPPRTAGDRATAASTTRRVTYASGHFSLAAGKSASVPAKLTTAGRTLARNHTRRTVYIVATLTNVKPARTLSRSLTLRF